MKYIILSTLFYIFAPISCYTNEIDIWDFDSLGLMLGETQLSDVQNQFRDAQYNYTNVNDRYIKVTINDNSRINGHNINQSGVIFMQFRPIGRELRERLTYVRAETSAAHTEAAKDFIRAQDGVIVFENDDALYHSSLDKSMSRIIEPHQAITRIFPNDRDNPLQIIASSFFNEYHSLEEIEYLKGNKDDVTALVPWSYSIWSNIVELDNSLFEDIQAFFEPESLQHYHTDEDNDAEGVSFIYFYLPTTSYNFLNMFPPLALNSDITLIFDNRVSRALAMYTFAFHGKNNALRAAYDLFNQFNGAMQFNNGRFQIFNTDTNSQFLAELYISPNDDDTVIVSYISNAFIEREMASVVPDEEEPCRVSYRPQADGVESKFLDISAPSIVI